VGTKGWAPKNLINFKTDPWSRSTYQQTDGIRLFGIREGGLGGGKHSKKAIGDMTQVINMQRWMIKKLVWYIFKGYLQSIRMAALRAQKSLTVNIKIEL
jgi:hypothetical protein